MKRKPEDDVHVRLDSPIEKRKVVIQATIDAVQLVKRYDNLIRIRTEKDQEYAEFRRVLSGINRMVKELRLKELPLEAEDLQRIKKMKGMNIVVPVMRRTEKVLAKKPVKKIEHMVERRSPIDRQLEDLQRKLQSL